MSTPVLAAAVTPQVVSRAAVMPLAAIAPAVTPTVTATPANPVAAFLGAVFALVNPLLAPNPVAPQANPLQLLVFTVFRSIEVALGVVPGSSTPGTGAGVPDPGAPSAADVAHTAYGDIGKWMLESNGQISDYGGQTYGGKTLLEPVNVIILDPTSTTPEESAAKLNAALTAAGYPPQPVHTTGFQGVINGTTYGQQPTGILEAFSDNFFLLPGDHARAFGPAPATNGGTGYVWTAAASSEVFGFNGLVPAHLYVSYDSARDALANRLASTGETSLGVVPLGNAYNTATVTTGDTDGNAVVIRLN